MNLNKGKNLNLVANAKEELWNLNTNSEVNSSSSSSSSSFNKFTNINNTVVKQEDSKSPKDDNYIIRIDHELEESASGHGSRNVISNNTTSSRPSSRNSFVEEPEGVSSFSSSNKSSNSSSLSSKRTAGSHSTPRVPPTYTNMIQRKFIENCSLILEKVPRDPSKVVRYGT
jgi:hypothetical protein